MGWAESRRWMDIRNPGSLADSWFLGLEGNFKGTGTAGYPGQVHNPMGMGKDNMREMQVKAGPPPILLLCSVLFFWPARHASPRSVFSCQGAAPAGS